MDKKGYLLSVFKLYSGKEKYRDENPVNIDNDEFKWYMWRNEFMYYENYEKLCERYGGSLDSEEGLKKGLEGYLKVFVSKWVGYPIDEKKEKEWYDRYQSYERV